MVDGRMVAHQARGTQAYASLPRIRRACIGVDFLFPCGEYNHVQYIVRDLGYCIIINKLYPSEHTARLRDLSCLIFLVLAKDFFFTTSGLGIRFIGFLYKLRFMCGCIYIKAEGSFTVDLLVYTYRTVPYGYHCYKLLKLTRSYHDTSYSYMLEP